MNTIGALSYALTQTLVLGVALEWTVPNYYILTAILHAVLIPVGFRVLQVDPEHNSIVGAVVTALIINAGAYFLRDAGVMGVLAVGLVAFGLLAAISSGEVLKALFMVGLMFGVWGMMGKVVLPDTPLEVDDVGGITRVLVRGGLEPEPITADDTDALSDPDTYITE